MSTQNQLLRKRLYHFVSAQFDRRGKVPEGRIMMLLSGMTIVFRKNIRVLRNLGLINLTAPRAGLAATALDKLLEVVEVTLDPAFNKSEERAR